MTEVWWRFAIILMCSHTTFQASLLCTANNDSGIDHLSLDVVTNKIRKGPTVHSQVVLRVNSYR